MKSERYISANSKWKYFLLIKFLSILFVYQLVFLHLSNAQHKNELASFVHQLKDTLRIADNQLNGAILALKNDDQNTFRDKHRKSTSLCLSTMERVKMYLYIQVQKNQRELNMQHNSDLKKLDDIVYESEQIFRKGMEFLFAALHSNQIENELLSLIQQYPHNQFIREYLIRCYEQQKRWEDVITEGEKLLTNYAESKQTHLSLGHAYEMIDRPSTAIISYTKALEIDVEDSTIYEILNSLYQNERRITDWIDYLKHLNRLLPRNNLIQQYLQMAGQSLEKAR